MLASQIQIQIEWKNAQKRQIQIKSNLFHKLIRQRLILNPMTAQQPTTYPIQSIQSLTVTFFHSSSPVFDITLQSPASTPINSILLHIFKTISLDIKENPQVFFYPINSLKEPQNLFSDSALKQHLDVNTKVGQTSGKLFYNLTDDHYNMLICEDFQRRNRPELPMKSKNMERKMKKLQERPQPQQIQNEKVHNITVKLNPLEIERQSNKQSPKKQSPSKMQSLKEQSPEKQPLNPLKSQKTIQLQKRTPNQSSHTKSQSAYFQQNQQEVTQTTTNPEPMPIPYNTQRQQQSSHLLNENSNQQQIQGRSGNVEQTKEDSCCQLI